ncbi:ATP-grasp domain-containing protein [Saccharothrix isguenensis]
MQTLLLVGVGRMGLPYLAAGRALGARVVAVETAQKAESIAGLVDHLTVARGGSDELWAEGAFAAVAAERPDGVIAFSEPQVLAASMVQEELGLPGPSLRAGVISRNKALQRGRFAAAGIAQPDHLVVDDLAGAAEWALERLPVVVKPLSMAGSMGVELVPDAAAFAEVAARRAGEGRLLVERAVEGPEYSWEALVVDGAVWFANVTAKETTGPPNFIEVAHRSAADVTDDVRTGIDRFGADVLAAMGMRSGLVHLEFRLTDVGPVLMEVAVRTPGDHLMELLGLTYGLDWFELVARVALGRGLPAAPTGPIRYAASYLPLATAGTVTAIRGLEAVREHKAVVEAGLAVAVDSVVEPARSSNQRVGQVLLAAGDRVELEAALAEVRRALVVETSPR